MNNPGPVEKILQENETPQDARLDTICARMAKLAIRSVLREYLIASTYFREIGAQTASGKYGGSRSLIYYQMLEGAHSLHDIRDRRKEYKGLHESQRSNHDESGGILRIAGYHMRGVPMVGQILEDRIRADDQLMVDAAFSYPEGLTIYATPVEAGANPEADNLPLDMHDH